MEVSDRVIAQVLVELRRIAEQLAYANALRIAEILRDGGVQGQPTPRDVAVDVSDGVWRAINE